MRIAEFAAAIDLFLIPQSAIRNPHSSHESYGSKHDDEQEDQ
jgi:hypothetical protein